MCLDLALRKSRKLKPETNVTAPPLAPAVIRRHRITKTYQKSNAFRGLLTSIFHARRSVAATLAQIRIRAHPSEIARMTLPVADDGSTKGILAQIRP